MRSPLTTEHRPIAEMIRGAQTVMSSLRSGILLISTPPGEWRPEKASSLGGVIVVPQDVTAEDLEIIRNRNLPFIVFTESNLPGPRVRVGQREAARELTERLLKQGHRRIVIFSGYDPSLDAPKRMGVHDALRDAQIDPTKVPEIASNGQESGIFQAAEEILRLRPRPTAVIAFDDSLASMISFQARRNQGLQVPGDISVVGFHDWPYLSYIEPAITTARFEFFTAGQRAAEALSRAALTGEPVSDICFEPTFRDGQTVGPASDVA
jgi:DNA-binding LacI/PurR family transcriptional regulator